MDGWKIYEEMQQLLQNPDALQKFLDDAEKTWRPENLRTLSNILALFLLRLGNQKVSKVKDIVLQFYCHLLIRKELKQEVEDILLSCSFAWKATDFWQNVEDTPDFPPAFRLCLAHLKRKEERCQ